ncbi:glycosyltransferase family 2 protein [Siccibacter turicensis]|uniref:glycosyltransferase family 2 protein n=1 Tax=Siccibacter turicensis TaxID=357233 RepID=UPI002A6A3AA6|nr:glycosyltransferase family 2 protein [Siccibacter turicensis]MDY0973027.1 glycosyltransferase family 2 protein [Siccibacter turicensis]
MFSVIMPAYNSAKTIEQSINSVLNQTYTNFELLIIDDCSTDGTLKVVEKYNDGRIKIIKNKFNVGVAKSRNEGIKKAIGRYIAFLDSDDLWLPTKLEEQYKHLSKGSTVVCSAYFTFSDNPKEIGDPIFFKEEIRYEDMLKSNLIGNLTGAYDSLVLGKVLQEDIGHEDYVMWLGLTKKAQKVYCSPTPLALYRRTSTSVSANKIRAMKWQLNIYHNHLKLHPFKIMYYFCHYVLFALKKRSA